MFRILALITLIATPGCTAEAPPVQPKPAATAAPAATRTAPAPRRYGASEIRITWRGADQAPASVSRGDLEAKGIADRVYARILSGGDFADIARAVSDAPTGRRGGQIGAFAPGTLDPNFELTIAGLSVGEVSPPFRTRFGWHVVRRELIDEVRVRSILIATQGASSLQKVRPISVARSRAESALKQLREGASFDEIALRYSDDPTRKQGGDLGFIARGQMVPAFEQAAFGLQPGELSDLVDTPYGVHILLRTE
jgi:parvulin-like peptidyl-prolyl isomerase